MVDGGDDRLGVQSAFLRVDLVVGLLETYLALQSNGADAGVVILQGRGRHFIPFTVV